LVSIAPVGNWGVAANRERRLLKSIDTLVMTFTLCTVDDAAKTLSESGSSNLRAYFSSPNTVVRRRSAWRVGRTG
jgi:hypothetical protein